MADKKITNDLIKKILGYMPNYINVYFAVPFIIVNEELLANETDAKTYIPLKLLETTPFIENKENPKKSLSLNTGYYFMEDKAPHNLFAIGEQGKGKLNLMGIDFNDPERKKYTLDNVYLIPINKNEKENMIFFELLFFIFKYKEFNSSDDKSLSDLFKPFLKVIDNKETLTEPIEKNKNEITPYNLNNITIKKFYVPNTKLSNEVTNDFLDYGKQPLRVISQKGKEDILSYCSLTYEGNDITLSGKQSFTPFDREIYNALTSLFVAGNKNFTTGTVFRALTGRSGKDKPSIKMKKEIEDSIEKCMFIKMTLDCTEELKARKLDFKENGKIISNLLRVDILDMGDNRERIYRFNDDPLPLYKYASIVNQVVSVPTEYLDTKDLGSDTKNNVLIKNYLLKEIEVIKGPTKRSNKILYSTLFEKTKIEINNKIEKKRYRDYIKSLMKYWIEIKSIKGYKEYKKGRDIVGIEIIY